MFHFSRLLKQIQVFWRFSSWIRVKAGLRCGPRSFGMTRAFRPFVRLEGLEYLTAVKICCSKMAHKKKMEMSQMHTPKLQPLQIFLKHPKQHIKLQKRYKQMPKPNSKHTKGWSNERYERNKTNSQSTPNQLLSIKKTTLKKKSQRNLPKRPTPKSKNVPKLPKKVLLRTEDDLYYLEQAAKVQVLAMSTGVPLELVDEKTSKITKPLSLSRSTDCCYWRRQSWAPFGWVIVGGFICLKPELGG